MADFYSKWKRETSSMPQSSILDPLLFVEEVVRSNMFMFTGDTKLLEEIHSKVNFNILKNDLNNLLELSER